MTVLLRSGDLRHHRSLATVLLARAKKKGLAGATLVEAAEGQGGRGVVHHQHLLRADVSLAVICVDDPASIDEFVKDSQDLLDGLVVVVEDVQVRRV
jgi:PII-like signaling protein